MKPYVCLFSTTTRVETTELEFVVIYFKLPDVLYTQSRQTDDVNADILLGEVVKKTVI